MHRALSRALQRAGDREGAAEAHHQAEVRGNAKEYAKRLRSRVEQGDHDDHTLRRYREALHSAHPDVAKHVKLYARWSDEKHKANRALESTPETPPFVKKRMEHRATRNSREKEAQHELEAAVHKGEKTGHNLGHFLSPLGKNTQGDDTLDHVRHGLHLARLHRLLNRGHQGSAGFGEEGNRITHSHYHDEHDQPEGARAMAHRHAALIRHHFPNADVGVHSDPETWAPREVVLLTNAHGLRPR